jgi:hypothetical protein
MELAAPPVLLKAGLLAEKLQNSVGDGVDIVLLLSTSGALLSTASNRTEFARSQECRMLAALTANLWRNYASQCSVLNAQSGNKGAGGAPSPAPAAAGATELDFILAELETNKLCVFGMGGRAVLALYAQSSVELGLLKLKAASLQGELFDGVKLALRQDLVPKADAFGQGK